MKIKVNQYYMGWNTNEQLIPAGVYEVGDPALFGLEEFLVNEQGKAEYVNDANEPAAPAVEPEVVSELETGEQVVEAAEAGDEEVEFKGRKLRARKAKE